MISIRPRAHRNSQGDFDGNHGFIPCSVFKDALGLAARFFVRYTSNIFRKYVESRKGFIKHDFNQAKKHGTVYHRPSLLGLSRSDPSALQCGLFGLPKIGSKVRKQLLITNLLLCKLILNCKHLLVSFLRHFQFQLVFYFDDKNHDNNSNQDNALKLSAPGDFFDISARMHLH